ncbi:MAG: YwaF family protein [Eubacteriales bacterium]|nr:YwaF family protein [Eubacteriales bacterium]
MQWASLLLWASLAVFGGRIPERRLITRLLLSLGLLLSMMSQLWLLHLDGLLTIQTGLPLHLCGFMGLLSIWMLWLPGAWSYHFSLLLGSPCAFLALCFPAVIRCSYPLWMSLSFHRLHVLILCTALFFMAQQKPLPKDGRYSFLLGNGYLLFVAIFNRAFSTNYLFLSFAPVGTPLALLFERGSVFYLCSLELLAMVTISAVQWMLGEKRLLPSLIAGNRSACSRCSHYILPCTIPRRE